MLKRLTIAICALGLVVAQTASVEAVTEESVTLVAVGDIAQLAGDQAATAELTTRINPDQILLLGDLAYYTGSAYEFESFFEPSWGVHASKSWAVPGNHEYGTTYARGYRQYAAAHGWPMQKNGDAWWVKEIAGSQWVVIGLDSEKAKGAVGVRQASFLKQALKKFPGQPVIMMWHRPRFSKGVHGNTEYMNQLWTIAMSDLDVKIFLWAHDHNYERRKMYKRLANGKLHTVRTFVVGTGGATLRNCDGGSKPPSLLCGTKNNFGVLKLTLTAKQYSWQFVRTNDQVADFGPETIK